MPHPNGNRAFRSCALVGIALGALVGAMALTNPSRMAYEQYATRRLSNYLSRNVCTDLPAGFGNLLRQQCNQLLEANQNTLRTVIQGNTQVQNFVLFSIYRTQLTVPNLEVLPAYQVETLGIFNQFFTYKAIEIAAAP
ncbi:hypothetical protein C7271_01820 [filamentous cyanobacterium CCP5]|nr:hypothetical protein C7271_01820 [filamentous cyanobacterium CCP5]